MRTGASYLPYLAVSYPRAGSFVSDLPKGCRRVTPKINRYTDDYGRAQHDKMMKGAWSPAPEGWSPKMDLGRD